MLKISRQQKGFGIVIVLALVALLAGIGFFVWRTTGTKNENAPIRQVTYPVQEDLKNNADDISLSGPGESEQLLWQQTESGWRSFGAVPSCPANPMMKAPADLSRATAILYPGQTRGGNYKPHGGFRFDGTTGNQVMVTAPIDGFIVRGGRYLAEGEVQYTFDVMNNCGVMYRVGHLRTLPDNLQKIAETWPEAIEGDSRTQEVNPSVFVRQGDVIATSVGILATKNAFFDWGVYDYRQMNAASKAPTYQQMHMQDKELSWHAVCWFGLLSQDDEAKVRSLPAGDPTSGKTSDYCK